MKMAAAQRTLEIAQPDLRSMVVTIKGITPLLCSNGAQAVPALEAAQTKVAKVAKEARNPEADFRASLYPLGDGYGFPAAAISRALRDASTRFVDKYSGKIVAGGVRIQSAGLLPIVGSEPRMDTAHVVHGGRSHDLAYRAAFDQWEIEVPLVHNATSIPAQQVLTLFELAGFSVGIGAWRPERNGSYGMFKVSSVKAD